VGEIADTPRRRPDRTVGVCAETRKQPVLLNGVGVAETEVVEVVHPGTTVRKSNHRNNGFGARSALIAPVLLMMYR
jgi:hypothetical protein